MGGPQWVASASSLGGTVTEMVWALLRKGNLPATTGRGKGSMRLRALLACRLAGGSGDLSLL